MEKSSILPLFLLPGGQISTNAHEPDCDVGMNLHPPLQQLRHFSEEKSPNMEMCCVKVDLDVCGAATGSEHLQLEVFRLNPAFFLYSWFLEARPGEMHVNLTLDPRAGDGRDPDGRAEEGDGDGRETRR